jgi:CO/xanthine dehydrogenase Mo-binding subunit
MSFLRSREQVAPKGIGKSVRRREDARLLTAALGVPAASVRVVSGDIGGNFGIRNNTCPEFVLAAWAARRVGRPVKWSCERRDAFATRAGL